MWAGEFQLLHAQDAPHVRFDLIPLQIIERVVALKRVEIQLGQAVLVLSLYPVQHLSHDELH